MKESYYFPHDYHARNDPKCAALLSDFGVAGYGLYWCVIEILHEQKDGKLEKFPKLFSGLAYDFNVSVEAVTKQIEAMVKDYNLIKEDEKYLWSDRVLVNLENRKLKYQIKSEAGRIGGLKSGESRRMKQSEAVLEANEPKERKRKERKRNFMPPTLEEVKEYISKNKYRVNAETFHKYFTEGDWIDSKGTKVRNWKLKIITWESNQNTKNQEPATSTACALCGNILGDRETRYEHDGKKICGKCDMKLTKERLNLKKGE